MNMSDQMIKEMNSAFMARQDNEDVTHIMQKYFPPGMEVEVALKQLHEKGFEIEEYVDTRVRSWPVGEFRQHRDMQGRPIPKGQKDYLASQKYDFIIKVPATKEARIIIESDGERIIKTNGYIFLHGI